MTKRIKAVILVVLVTALVLVPSASFAGTESCHSEHRQCKSNAERDYLNGIIGTTLGLWNELNRCDYEFAVCLTPFLHFLK